MSKTVCTPKAIQKAQKHATRNERHEASATLRGMLGNASSSRDFWRTLEREVEVMRTPVRHYQEH